MHFAVDAHAIGCNLTGNEVYVRNLLNSFAVLEDAADFTAYYSVSEATSWLPPRFRRRRVARSPFLRLGCDLSRKLYQDRPDLLHVQYTAPWLCPVPVVVSVHDVSFHEYPEFFTPPRARQLQWTVRRTIQRGARILTGSEFSRQAIARNYGLDGENITVIPNAAASMFRPLAREPALAAVRARFGIPGPFLLTVGDLQPRKNHLGLIRAFTEMVLARPQLPHRLVLAGKETWFAPRIHKAAQASGAADRIHFTGFVTDEELLRLYNACDVFVFPSFYEGFGLPVLEAMACGRAVACSNASALVEVVDAAAILFEPHSSDEIVRAMLDLLLDAELRARMERIGLQRAAQFSWHQTARKTLEVYHEVAARGARAARERYTHARP